ncbi:ROK family protein [Paracoccus sp. CPCC 101403]|uniref:ROK family protein n=1 Tax=Paracoccus broussonetiae TaxID=3075834 RepID=A0ABU3EI66_9RHOB|nr:ROK family protein [Paracoccus sp. CPCC 101403]MDT1063942.1 ROK family protein [Paracoccus sp. CPCC 101403]
MAGMICGAIDLGGTKIEARLFDGNMQTIALKRAATPREDFESFIAALVQQIRWLESSAQDQHLPVAISMAGLIDPQSGIATASNIPVSGQNLGKALRDALGRSLPMVNDCMAFAYSEAHGGAGERADSVLGLILGTGVGAGWVIDGHIPRRNAGLAVEIGHVGMPDRAIQRHGLPTWPCGCGRMACHENYVSGTGLRRIAEWAGIAECDPAVIAGRAAQDAKAARVMGIWADLTGEMLYTAQLILDPQVIVLGGGLSNIPGLPGLLTAALGRLRLGQVRLPEIRVARHGDSSGARGAALMARAGMTGELQ